MRIELTRALAVSASLIFVACGGGGGGSGPGEPPQTYTLSVTIADNGFVESAPTGIDCHADCSETYASDTLVTLVPFVAAGQAFTGWSGDADCSDGKLTMAAPRACTATFAGAAVAAALLWLPHRQEENEHAH